jgi:hypothetical protein
MAIRRNRDTQSLAVKSMQIALAAPQVVAHRVARMALAGPNLSARDRQEFKTMVGEKHAAFVQSWSNMYLQTLRANQAIATSMVQSFFSPLSYGKSAASISAQVQRAAVGVLAQGLAPIHRKAVSNARRLAKTKLR